MTLSEAKPGQSFVITGYQDLSEHPSSSYRQKLLSLGLTRGTRIRIQKIAPLGDPVEILARGYHLSLRKHEAKILLLEACSNE